MKPFDLKKALAGAKVVTRSEEEVLRVIHIPEITKSYNKVIAVFDDSWLSCSETGKYWPSSEESPHDLFMATEKKEGWIIIYHEGNSRTTSQNIWYSEEQAQNWAAGCSVGCSVTRIEWYE